MKQTYTTDAAFAHAVRYNEAMINAWLKRTGRMDNRGFSSYRLVDLPPWIDYPTNDDRGRAECIRFLAEPLPRGKSYAAYLAHAKPEHIARYAASFGNLSQGVITTYNGELLAVVTQITANRVTNSHMTNERGTFWAVGIDGRTYYGRHSGRGMYCLMRLAKYQTTFDIQQRTSEGWETVSSELSHKMARAAVREYRVNQPEFDVKIKKVRSEQT